MLANRSPGVQIFEASNFGGLITEVPEELLPINKFKDLIDFRTDRNGVLELRERVTYLTFYGIISHTDPVTWFYRVILNNNLASPHIPEAHVVFAIGRPTSPDSAARIKAMPESTIDLIGRAPDAETIHVLNSNYYVNGTAFDNALIVQNAFTPIMPLQLNDIPALAQRYEGVIGKFAVPWRERLCIAATARNEREVIFTALLKGDRWADYSGSTSEFTPFAGDFWSWLGAKSVVVSDDASEWITGIVIWNNRPVVGTNKGLYYIDENFGCFLITRETGVIERTMCIYRNAVWFLGDDDVYILDSLSSVKPITRNTINSAIFKSNLQTRNTLQPCEFVVDTYEDWTNLTATPAGYGAFTWYAGPAAVQSCDIVQGGYIVTTNIPVVGTPDTYGDRETDPICLAELPPDCDSGGVDRSHLSNWVRIDVEMTDSIGDLLWTSRGSISDADYVRDPVQLYVAVKQADTSGGLAAVDYTEIGYLAAHALDSGYIRDNRRLSFVYKIDTRTDSNVFDKWIQVAVRIHSRFRAAVGSDPDITSQPKVHRIRISWLKAVKSGTSYLDYRQQPYMTTAKDKLWLHLTGRTTTDDTYAFVMDNRGEWTKYRNLDCSAMLEVEAYHPANQQRYNRFIIGRRWSRLPTDQYYLYIETEEYPDYLRTLDPTHAAIAQSGKLAMGDPFFMKRMRYILIFYQGAYSVPNQGDLSKFLWTGSQAADDFSWGVNLPYHAAIPAQEVIDTVRREYNNYGNWFQWQVQNFNPWTLNHDLKISKILFAVVPMTAKPTLGQTYVGPGGGGGGT